MTDNQLQLRHYLELLSDKMTPEEGLFNLQIASHYPNLPQTLKPLIQNYLSLSDQQLDEVRLSL